MFDYEDMMMGPKKKGKSRPLFGDMGASMYEQDNYKPRTTYRRASPRYSAKRKYYKPKKTKSSYKPKKTKSSYKPRSFSKDRQKPSSTIQKITKGYSGSAKQEYQRKEKQFKQRQEEAKYKRKLKEEYPTKVSKIGSKVKGLFKKKSIYK